MLKLLVSLRDDLGRTLVLVLNDLNHAARHGDHRVAMKQGKIVAKVPPLQVLTPAIVREVPSAAPRRPWGSLRPLVGVANVADVENAVCIEGLCRRGVVPEVAFHHHRAAQPELTVDPFSLDDGEESPDRAWLVLL